MRDEYEEIKTTLSKFYHKIYADCYNFILHPSSLIAYPLKIPHLLNYDRNSDSTNLCNVRRVDVYTANACAVGCSANGNCGRGVGRASV